MAGRVAAVGARSPDARVSGAERRPRHLVATPCPPPWRSDNSRFGRRGSGYVTARPAQAPRLDRPRTRGERRGCVLISRTSRGSDLERRRAATSSGRVACSHVTDHRPNATSRARGCRGRTVLRRGGHTKRPRRSGAVMQPRRQPLPRHAVRGRRPDADPGYRRVVRDGSPRSSWRPLQSARPNTVSKRCAAVYVERLASHRRPERRLRPVPRDAWREARALAFLTDGSGAGYRHRIVASRGGCCIKPSWKRSSTFAEMGVRGARCDGVETNRRRLTDAMADFGAHP